MIEFTLDKEAAILHIRPMGPLAKEDFDRLATKVDPYLDEAGELAGLILEVRQFPGWGNFSAMIRHVRFIHDHHKRIKRVAVVTDSKIGDLAEHITAHFIAAEVRHFAANQFADARAWITATGTAA